MKGAFSMHKKIRMIVSDLDGTMVDDTFHIPEENIKAVKEAAARGVLVTIATGRMYRSALPYAKKLGIDVPLIAYNGAIVKTVGGERISTEFLPPDVVKRVLRFVFEHGWYVQLYSEGKLYYAEATEAALAYEKASGVPGNAVGKEGLLERTDEVPKLLVVTKDEASGDEALSMLAEAFPSEILVMKSKANYIEVVLPGVSKAKAVLELAQKHGIAADEIMALGDSGNDVSMLKACGLGVAMGNASEAVKAEADVVTGICEEGGVAEAIHRYVLEDGQ